MQAGVGYWQEKHLNEKEYEKGTRQGARQDVKVKGKEDSWLI